MSKQVVEALIQSNQEIAKGVYKMVIQSEVITKDVRPGQFVNLYTRDASMLLPRPISICEVNGDTLVLVYGVVGKGTQAFATYQPGEMIRVSCPLGNGYTLEKKAKHILVGGGIGVPPLVELAKRLEGEVIAVVGFREEPFLVDTLESYGVKVYVATDTGAYGFKGNVVELMKQHDMIGDMYYSCGPKPMLKALSAFCEQQGVEVQVSLEERMGCGYGACVGCVCDTKTKEGKVEHKKVCCDGPVFLGSEVAWS